MDGTWLRGPPGCFNVRDIYRLPNINYREGASVVNACVTDRWEALLGDTRTTTIGNRGLPGGD